METNTFQILPPEVQERLLHTVSYGTAIIFVCCILVIFATLIDMWTGVEAARANKEKINSRSLRKTVKKASDYLKVIIFSILIDILGLFFPWYDLPYCVILCTLGILLIEGKSVIENFRKKKSHAADVLEMASKIINCLDDKDARKLIEEIKSKPINPETK